MPYRGLHRWGLRRRGGGWVESFPFEEDIWFVCAGSPALFWAVFPQRPLRLDSGLRTQSQLVIFQILWDLLPCPWLLWLFSHCCYLPPPNSSQILSTTSSTQPQAPSLFRKQITMKKRRTQTPHNTKMGTKLDKRKTGKTKKDQTV